jgi:hypothetical protein
MSTKTKLIFRGLFIFSLLSLAGVALASTFASTTYLPIVYKQPTPLATSTPTVTATPRAPALITHIEADPKGPDLESEFVTIKNVTGSSLNMTGWALRDNTKHTYEFPSFSLGAGREVDVWSKDGEDDAANLYWGLTVTNGIWDNDDDCGLLYDDDGALVHEFCYDRVP